MGSRSVSSKPSEIAVANAAARTSMATQLKSNTNVYVGDLGTELSDTPMTVDDITNVETNQNCP